MICPSPQMEVSRMALKSSSMTAKSFEPDSPRDQRAKMSTNFWDPTLQGTHLPHDSLRKKRVELMAMSNIQRPSAQTTTAPDPTMEPASARALKSRGKSTFEAGKYPDEGPEGANPSKALPSGIPPAKLK